MVFPRKKDNSKLFPDPTRLVLFLPLFSNSLAALFMPSQIISIHHHLRISHKRPQLCPSLQVQDQTLSNLQVADEVTNFQRKNERRVGTTWR
jgi:hypothetical protein